MSRLQDLKNKLKARTRSDGSALPNYQQNVDALRKEIARLEEVQNGD